MPPASVARLRATAQGVARPRARSPAEAVSSLLAVQAQDWLGTQWAVALRTRSPRARAVDDALARGDLVRTWAFRGTLFLLAAKDLRWVLDLVAPRALAAAQGRHRQLGLDARAFARAADALGDAVARGARRTRGELLAALRDARVATAGQRGAHLLQHASYEGILAQCAVERNEPVFRSAAPLLRRGRARAREDALAELAARYVRSRGPAGARDLAWFAGIPLADAKAGLAGARGLVERDEGWRATRARGVASGIRLLPGFDELMLGYQDRSATMPPERVRAWWPGGGSFRYVVVKDGLAVGTWRREVKRSGVEVKATPFARWSPADRAGIREEAQRYAAFLEKPLQE